MKTVIERRGLTAAALLISAGLLAGCTAFTANGVPSGSPAASGTPSAAASGTLPPPASASLTPAPYQTSDPRVSFSPPPPATPTPSPMPGTWRWEGVVVDEQGRPIEGVCVVVGPSGCQPTNPRTDARGVWYVDFPQAEVQYDLHFTKDGYRTYSARITPTSSWTYNVVLSRG